MKIKVLRILKDSVETQKFCRDRWMAEIQTKSSGALFITGFDREPTIREVISAYFSEMSRSK